MGRRPIQRHFSFVSFSSFQLAKGEQMEILRRLNTADLQANYQNLLCLWCQREKRARCLHSENGYVFAAAKQHKTP